MKLFVEESIEIAGREFEEGQELRVGENVRRDLARAVTSLGAGRMGYRHRGT